jgi:hypothetical protein
VSTIQGNRKKEKALGSDYFVNPQTADQLRETRGYGDIVNIRTGKVQRMHPTSKPMPGDGWKWADGLSRERLVDLLDKATK